MTTDIVLPANFAPDFEPVLSQDLGDRRAEYPVTRYGRTFVTHSGVALRHLRPLPETLFPTAPSKDRHLARYARYKYLTTPRVRLHGDDLLLLHNHWSRGYYHWLAETMVKVQFVDPARYTLILPGGFPEFVRDGLLLFDWRATAVVPAGSSVAAQALTIVSNPSVEAFNPVHVDWLRTTLRGKCGVGDDRPVRIYLTRRSARMRRIVNEVDVTAALASRGFQIVDAAELSFAEQVRLFSRCEALVTPHGAGFTNMVFMSSGASVLELYRELTPALPKMNITYWRLATAAGLRYHYQYCAHGPQMGPKIDDVDLTVDIEKLERNVELMLAGA